MISSRTPWITIGVVILLAAMSGWLRGSIAGTESLWLDELHTSWCVGGPLADVARRAADGNQSPLYFWLTWLSVRCFGHTEFSSRLISLFAGVGTILASSFVIWRWTRCSVATLMVAWLVSVGSVFIYYGSEARPYALVQCLGVIQAGLFLELFGKRSPGNDGRPARPGGGRYGLDVGLVIATWLLVYTHVTSIWLLAAEVGFAIGVWQIGPLSGRLGVQAKGTPASKLITSNDRSAAERGLKQRLMLDALVAAMGCLPLMFLLAFVFERRGNWQGLSSISTVWADVAPQLLWMIAVPLVSLLASVGYHRWRDTPGPNFTDGRTLAFVLLWALVPTLSLTVMEATSIAPLALPRYALVGAVAFPLFAGLCVNGIGTLLLKLGLALVVIVGSAFHSPMLIQVARSGQIPQLRYEDWLTPIEMINDTESKSAQPVTVFSNLIEDGDAYTNRDERFQEYLKFPVSGMYRLERQGRLVVAGPTLARSHFNEMHAKAMAARGGGWALVRGRFLVDEIGHEIRERTAIVLGRPAQEIRVSLFSVESSDVYLLSIDW